MSKLVLSEEGFKLVDRVYNEKTKKHRTVSKRVALGPGKLLRSLHRSFEISGKPSLASLMMDLASTGTIGLVGDLVGRDLGPYVEDLKKIPIDNEKKDEEKLVAIEVYKSFEIDRKAGHDSIGGWGSAHGIGEKGTHFAIEFTSWGALAFLPIRLREKAYVSSTFWKKCKKPRKFMGFDVKTEIDKHEDEDLPCHITFYDFLVYLFDELAWFPSPAERDGEMQKLNKIMEDVKSGKAKTYSWDELKAKKRKKKTK